MPPAETPPAPPGPGSTRSTPRAWLVVAGALLVARVATGLWEERHPPRAPEQVDWQPIAGAEARARAQKKPILYDFTADWCPPCRVMQREMFADRGTAEQIEKHFVPVRVLDRRREDGRNLPEVDSLQARYGVAAFPTLVVVPPDGGEPVVLAGYRGASYTLQRLTDASLRLRRRQPGFGLP